MRLMMMAVATCLLWPASIFAQGDGSSSSRDYLTGNKLYEICTSSRGHNREWSRYHPFEHLVRVGRGDSGNESALNYRTPHVRYVGGEKWAKQNSRATASMYS